MKNKIVWQLFNMTYDGLIINDFDDDADAIQHAANLEATCYRIENGKKTLIYDPKEAD